MNTITVEILGQQLQAGSMPRLLDVRSPAEFSRFHAEGACLIPLEELTPATIASACLDSDECFYVLCQSGKRAATACEKLESFGVLNAVCVDGGTLAWDKASLPVVRNVPNAISIERQVRIAAGALVLLGLFLAWRIHPAFVGITVFVGAGLVFAGVTDFCGLGILMSKLPWNQKVVKRVEPPLASRISTD